MRRTICLGVICLIASAFTFAIGQTPGLLPTRLQTRYSNLTSPIFLTHAGDGTKRIFIVERGGIIKVVQPGSNTPSVFLNISTLTTTDGERGLLGLAFHPNYENNRRFFVYFTRSDGDLQISEFEASPADPNVALIAEKPILTIEHSQNNNHNGGTIAFGPDGYLYAGPGDGGSGNDPPNNAQNLNSLLGKVLRIDVNVPAGQNVPYLIPPGNPFAGATAGADEIFAYGLRNPFRWSFDRGGTNQLWLADVGQNAWEEVDIIVNGGNYGWRIMEGNVCTPTINSNCTPPAGHIPPVFVYSSEPSSSRCSITGGYVYRGGLGTLPNGSYIYGDYCTGEILLWYQNQQILLHNIADFNLVSFGEDEDGELYVVHANANLVQKIVPAVANADFDGDLRTDLTIYRQATGWWYFRNPATGAIWSEGFYCCNKIPAPADFDRDLITDLGVFDPNEIWIFRRSSDNSIGSARWGTGQDIPLPGDYDGDGRADLVVWRPSDGGWYVFRSSDSTFSSTQWGVNGDIPLTTDFDGDGRYDFTVWRPSDGGWYTVLSSNRSISTSVYGVANDVPAPGDFDNDGRTDLAIFRPSTGEWFRKLSNNNAFAVNVWGVQNDVPVVGDYDADARDDIAVWRPSSGTWFIIRSTAGFLEVPGWGLQGDIPVPSRDRP